MPEPDRTVQCPICDADFDPAVAGGWCTNPDCGEWQYDGDIEAADAGDVTTGQGASADVELLEDTESTERLPSTPGPATNGHYSESQTESRQASADESDTPVEVVPVDGVDDDQRPEASSADDVAADATDDDPADANAPTDHGEVDEPSPADHETESSPGDHEAGPPTREADDDEGLADDGPSDGSSAGDAESAQNDAEREDEPAPTDANDDDEPATIDCPDCGRELDADANFCLDCGADVQDISPGGPEPLDACPACDTAVDDDASFCINCGENLDAHRNGASETGSGDDSTADSAADGSSAGDAVEALSSQSADESAVPDGLVLSVAGRDIDVADGDRVGREIRAALIDAGQPEDEAVRIHREHVRFDREADGYYLVDLGDNPTRLNGTVLQKGDRERVEPGDELELSGVVTIAIRAR